MEKLGKYGHLERLSHGPLGPVYQAYDPSTKRQVMIRTIGADFPWDTEMKARFGAECAAITGLRHPNIATLYEQAEEGVTTYVVTELPAGKDLKSLIAENAAMTVEVKLSAMIQVAAGLNQAHAHGLLHRVLKPDNIRILPGGTARITDFEVGSLLAIAGNPPLMQPQDDIYAAPEQVLGKPSTCRSDVFRLGLVFYELLTGMHPFHADDSRSIRENILNQASFPTVEQFPDVPLGLWPVLEKCLAADPAERYASMDEFGIACRGVLNDLAEDSELIRIELQTALPRLRQAAHRPDAPRGLADLQSEVETALAGGEKPDYCSLNRLLAALAQHYHLLQSPQAPACDTPDPSGDMPPLNEIPAADEARVEGGISADPPPVKIPPPPPPAGKDIPEAGISLAPALPVASTPVSANVRPDSISDLIRDIDEGQERIQQTVESFLSRRQPGQSQATPLPEDIHGAPETPAGIPLPPPPPGNQPAAATAGARQTTDQAQHRFGRSAQGSPEVFHADVPGGFYEAVPEPLPRQEVRRTTLWICAAALLLTLALAIPLWIGTRGSPTAGRTGASQSRGAGNEGSISGAAQPTDPIAEAIRDRLNFARRDILLEEAQVLRAVGRLDESRMFLKRLLELYPAYQPAMTELSRLEAEMSPPDDKKETDPPEQVQKLLTNAAASIRTGKVQRAKADLDQADQLQPGLWEVVNLRKRLEAKNAELTQALAHEQAKQEAAQKQKAGESLTRRTEDLYRQGKYDDALAVLDEQLLQNPEWSLAQDLRSRTQELQRNLKTYEAALNAGKNVEALAALEKVERINASDPNLASLRKRAEVRPAPGTASLSLLPLGEPASLVLDDQPAGASGELINHTVSAGRHKIAARNSQGTEVALVQDFSNGQKVTIVYDLARQVMRPMIEADRELMNRNKAKQQVHRFNVEHPHGVLRGSCRGELLVSYFDVVYRPATGSHGFNIPFKTLKARVEDKTVILMFAMDGREFSSFRFQDAQAALSLKKAWDDLSALDR